MLFSASFRRRLLALTFLSDHPSELWELNQEKALWDISSH
jgi:hypothetical protein